MVAAVNAVRRKDMGLEKAAKSFNIPRRTLKNYVKKSEHDVDEMKLGFLGRKPVLPPETKKSFANFGLNMKKKL
jgi:hypothetical protein